MEQLLGSTLSFLASARPFLLLMLDRHQKDINFLSKYHNLAFQQALFRAPLVLIMNMHPSVSIINCFINGYLCLASKSAVKDSL